MPGPRFERGYLYSFQGTFRCVDPTGFGLTGSLTFITGQIAELGVRGRNSVFGCMGVRCV